MTKLVFSPCPRVLVGGARQEEIQSNDGAVERSIKIELRSTWFEVSTCNGNIINVQLSMKQKGRLFFSTNGCKTKAKRRGGLEPISSREALDKTTSNNVPHVWKLGKMVFDCAQLV